jgi:hypothetical protein
LSERPPLERLRATHEFEVKRAELEPLGELGSLGDYLIWQLKEGDWLIGTAEGFRRYNPETKEAGPEILLPKGLLPKYLNYRTLGVAADETFALIGLDSLDKTFLFLDLVKGQARVTKIPAIPAARTAKYLGKADVFVCLDEFDSSLEFFSKRPLGIPNREGVESLRAIELKVGTR